MGISSISFWQQNRNWLQSQQQWDEQLNSSNAASLAITNALTNKSAGIASIANQQALTRVTKQLQTAATAALQGGSSGSSSLSSGPSVLSASGILPSSATNIASASTAESVLSSVLSNEGSSSGLAGLLSGSSVNIFA